MTELSQTIRTILFIRRGRLRKKLSLYKATLSVLLDWVYVSYLLGILGYLAYAVVRYRPDVVGSSMILYESVAQNIELNIYVLFIAYMMRYVISSFMRPLLPFTTSDYTLRLLPNRLSNIWIVLAGLRLSKIFIVYILSGFLIATIFPVSLKIVAGFVLALMILDCIWLIPNWVLFQEKSRWKFTIVGVLLVANILGFLYSTPLVASILLVAMLIVNVLLWRRFIAKSDWEQITTTSDYFVWNSRLISFGSNTKLEHPVINRGRKKKRKHRPFYNKAEMYRTLWRLYFSQNTDRTFQIMGSLLLILIVTQALPEFIFYIVLGTVLLVCGPFSKMLFKDHLESGLVQLLPWNLKEYETAYLRLVIPIGLFLFIPILIFYVRHWDLYAPFEITFILLAYVAHVLFSLKKARLEMDVTSVNPTIYDGSSFLFIIAIFFFGIYPGLSFGVVLLPALLFLYFKTEAIK